MCGESDYINSDLQLYLAVVRRFSMRSRNTHWHLSPSRWSFFHSSLIFPVCSLRVRTTESAHQLRTELSCAIVPIVTEDPCVRISTIAVWMSVDRIDCVGRDLITVTLVSAKLVSPVNRWRMLLAQRGSSFSSPRAKLYHPHQCLRLESLSLRGNLLIYRQQFLSLHLSNEFLWSFLQSVVVYG